MKERIDSKLMKPILGCRKCKEQKNLKKYFPKDCPPVCCFGDPFGKNGRLKKVIVVGINPSEAEYTDGHLKSDSDKALESQTGYFESEHTYRFFRELARFFDDAELRGKLGIEKKVWDKVCCLDLVKCVIRTEKGKQWNGLKPSEKIAIQKNCEHFLEEQLNNIRPRLIVAYGKDVGKWFGIKDSESEEFNFISKPRKLSFKYEAIYVPQRQGRHSCPEVNEVRAKIKEASLEGYARKRVETG
jgi:hypothetical protein